MIKAVVLTSGGQDSTTALYWAIRQFGGPQHVAAISFIYGQKHEKEVQFAQKIAIRAKIDNHVFFSIPELYKVSKSNLFVGEGDVNELNEKNLPSSFVPNRNMLFLTLAHAYAQSVGAKNLVAGVCQTDYSGYPDCRQQFITAFQDAANLGSDSEIEVLTPLMYLNKAETWALAEELGIVDEIKDHTLTCYNGETTNRIESGFGCGNCPACKIRERGYREFLQAKAESR